MAIRKVSFAPGEYYHILARGVNKQQLFFDNRDFARFLFYILFYQCPRHLNNTGDYVDNFTESGNFGVSTKTIGKVIEERVAELVCFVLMENHVHLLLGEIKKGGISKMMQRILDGYSRYSHSKYKKSGHIFEGPFKAIHVEDNEQLLYLSTYIHKNPKEIKNETHRWERYPWSSYQDFVNKNRWGELLASEIILSQFDNSQEYERFTGQSIAKEIGGKIDDLTLIDNQ